MRLGAGDWSARLRSSWAAHRLGLEPEDRIGAGVGPVLYSELLPGTAVDRIRDEEAEHAGDGVAPRQAVGVGLVDVLYIARSRIGLSQVGGVVPAAIPKVPSGTGQRGVNLDC